MGAVNVPTALSDRLGEPATAALVQMFDEERQTRTEAIVQQCTDRFERRLVEETSKLRTEFGQLRSGFDQLRTDVRVEIAGLRTEMVAGRFELLKWAFIFWVGQFVSVVGFVGLMLRVRP